MIHAHQRPAVASPANRSNSNQISSLFSDAILLYAFRQHSVLLIFQPKARIVLLTMSKYSLVLCISTFQISVDYYSLVEKDKTNGKVENISPKVHEINACELKKKILK